MLLPFLRVHSQAVVLAGHLVEGSRARQVGEAGDRLQEAEAVISPVDAQHSDVDVRAHGGHLILDLPALAVKRVLVDRRVLVLRLDQLALAIIPRLHAVVYAVRAAVVERRWIVGKEVGQNDLENRSDPLFGRLCAECGGCSGSVAREIPRVGRNSPCPNRDAAGIVRPTWGAGRGSIAMWHAAIWRRERWRRRPRCPGAHRGCPLRRIA